MNPTTYKNPLEAQNALTSSFNPTNEAQRQAIAQASALVPVTPSALTPTQPITPVVPPQRPIATPAFDLTPQETGAEQGVRTGISDIQSLLGDLAGENIYRAEQQQAQDIIGKKSAISSYQNQLKTLQSQGQGIQLQLQQDFQNLQNQAQQGGANVTKGGLDPQRRALQTQSNQQLLSNAIQQYSVGAQLSAAQGDYATALQYVDQAVSLKYQGKKDQLAAAQANLELLLKSPDLTSAQEKRALARQQIIRDEERKVKAEEENDRAVRELAVEASRNGATQDIIDKILKAPDQDTALSIASRSLGESFRQKLAQQAFENSITRREMELKTIASQDNENTKALITDVNTALGSNKIGQGTKTALSTILGVINATEDLAKATPNGDFAGLYPGRSIVDFALPDLAKRTKTITNEGYLDAINLKVQQWASGASLTKEQIAQVARFTPSKNDTDKAVKAKMNNLVDFMQQQIKGTLQAEGIQYEPQKADLFNEKQTLEQIFQ